jgi:hypothetical protein
MIEQSLSLVVVPLPGDAVADSTAGVGGIAVVAGDDVALEMKDGLAGGLAAVHAHVAANCLRMLVISITILESIAILLFRMVRGSLPLAAEENSAQKSSIFTSVG